MLVPSPTEQPPETNCCFARPTRVCINGSLRHFDSNILVATAAKEILLYTGHYIFLSCQIKKMYAETQCICRSSNTLSCRKKTRPTYEIGISNMYRYLPSLVQPLRITPITQVTCLKTFLESLEDDATSEARSIVMMHIKSKTPKTFDEVAS